MVSSLPCLSLLFLNSTTIFIFEFVYQVGAFIGPNFAPLWYVLKLFHRRYCSWCTELIVWREKYRRGKVWRNGRHATRHRESTNNHVCLHHVRKNCAWCMFMVIRVSRAVWRRHTREGAWSPRGIARGKRRRNHIIGDSWKGKYSDLVYWWTNTVEKNVCVMNI